MKWLNRIKDQMTFMRFRTRVILYLLLICVLGGSIYFLYTDYKNNIVAQQQQHMLSISQSIARSIDLYVDEVLDSMQIITFEQGFVENLKNNQTFSNKSGLYASIKAFTDAEGRPIYGAYIFDKHGKAVTQISQGHSVSNNLKLELQKVTTLKTSYIGKVYLDPKRKSFLLNVYEPIIHNGQFIGTLCAAIDLEVIYEKLIDPIKIGGKGYALVKDQDGIIIMHKLKEQIGYDVIDTRKAIYPDLDFTELERLIDLQLKGVEGTAIFHSYWWADKGNLKRAKKISAFTPVNLGEHFWVVGLTMSYDEIQRPINIFLIGVMSLALFIAMVFHFVLQALTKVKLSKEELEQETIYLKMLNESSEQLRQQESELYHSQKLKMIGTLAGGIAHDINNLLTPIYGYSELLLSQMDSDHAFKEEIDEIYKASQKGKDLIEQLLLFSRKDNGMTSISKVNINEVTEDTLRLFKTVIPNRTKITADLEEGCGIVSANFTQLHQVIFNLCNNAYHAIKDNEGSIHVSLKKIPVSLINDNSDHLEEAYNFVELSVTDTGCGMDSETNERLFEPFFTTKEIGEGTGLGLFVVKSIIDKYNGQIQVESTPGKGSTFKVYLQVEESDPQTETKDLYLYTSQEDAMGATAPSPEAIRILVVDDNDTVNRLLKKGLQYYGFHVTTETSSINAYKSFKANPNQYDLMITDYMMPDQKGTELAKKVRKMRKDLGIILMTGFMDESQVTLATNKAIDAYILKPIEIARLSDAILKVYEKRHTQR